MVTHESMNWFDSSAKMRCTPQVYNYTRTYKFMNGIWINEMPKHNVTYNVTFVRCANWLGPQFTVQQLRTLCANSRPKNSCWCVCLLMAYYANGPTSWCAVYSLATRRRSIDRRVDGGHKSWRAPSLTWCSHNPHTHTHALEHYFARTLAK